MKMLSETKGLTRLKGIRDEFRSAVGVYEQNAAACATCLTPGACCLDEHFVNVRISRLEAVAVRNVLADLPIDQREEVLLKIAATIQSYGLDTETDRTFACPLYDREVGCLVHQTAKPFPCMHHACYERKVELPPDELLDDAELCVERLNLHVYGRSLPLMPLPVAIQKVLG